MVWTLTFLVSHIVIDPVLQCPQCLAASPVLASSLQAERASYKFISKNEFSKRLDSAEPLDENEIDQHQQLRESVSYNGRDFS